MKIEKGIISSTQLMFLIIFLLQSSTLTAAFISMITKQNTWIVLLAGFIIMLFLLLIYTSLSRKYPGRNLIEINSEIYGHHFGKVMSILYIVFFWNLVPANVRLISDFFATYLLSETDISVFAILIIISSIYTVRKGLEVIARVSFIISVLTITISVALTILTIENMRLSNFLPLFQINLKEFIQGINLMLVIPFGELIVFMMVFPYVNNLEQVKESAIWGLIIGSIFFGAVILRNTAVLGNIGSIHVLPTYQVAKFINVGDIITRMEILIALILLFIVFLKVCIFYYATVLAIAQFFKLPRYKPIVAPVGIISLVLSITMNNSVVEQSYVAANIYPIFAIPFIILFPIISWIIVSIKKTT